MPTQPLYVRSDTVPILYSRNPSENCVPFLSHYNGGFPHLLAFRLQHSHARTTVKRPRYCLKTVACVFFFGTRQGQTSKNKVRDTPSPISETRIGGYTKAKWNGTKQANKNVSRKSVQKSHPGRKSHPAVGFAFFFITGTALYEKERGVVYPFRHHAPLQ